MAESEEFETQPLEKTPTGNDKTSKTRWFHDEVDELIDMIEERVCLWDVCGQKITTIETEEKRQLKKSRSNCRY